MQKGKYFKERRTAIMRVFHSHFILNSNSFKHFESDIASSIEKEKTIMLALTSVDRILQENFNSNLVFAYSDQKQQMMKQKDACGSLFDTF